MEYETNNRLGLIIAGLGALVCIVGTLMLFTRWYDPVIEAEIAAGRPDEGVIVQYIFPFLSDLGVLAGVLWAIAAYGFGTRRSWAWSLAIIANIVALQSSFFPMIPPVTRDLPPYSGIVFFPNLVFYGLLLLVVRRVDWRIAIVGLFSGIVMVLSFMSGVASTDKIIMTGMPLFVAVQRLNWLAALGWCIFTAGLLIKPVEWVRLVGMGAAILELAVGFPLGIVTALEAGRFSMFLPAPLLSLALFVLLLVPWGNKSLPNSNHLRGACNLQRRKTNDTRFGSKSTYAK